MTVGHLKEIIQYLPDDMLVMAPIGLGEESIIRAVCNKSRVQQISVSDCGHVETVLLLEPCVCDLEMTEYQEDIAHDLIVNPAIDN